MNLSTNYLGLALKHPLMPGASPMVDNLDLVRRLEDAGAAAIVMHSLFEEQIDLEGRAYDRDVESYNDSFSEALSFLPEADEFALTPDQYLEQLRRVKAAVGVPVIGSLNGATLGGWTRYAGLMESAGADAIELNCYDLPSDPAETARTVEGDILEILRSVRRSVAIPVALKLSPFFSSLPNFARKAADAGAGGLVLFNRFYQPDIDIENLEVLPTLEFSTSSELRLRLRWLAILHGGLNASLAVSGGVHSSADAIKAIMAGADAVQMVSALLQHGPERLGDVLREMTRWLEDHEYESLDQLRGSMSLWHCPDPSAFERANYMRILQGWRV
ncbi:MAG: dihydroorotate dehydrogenase-like protein [Terrimicrobiaceae bacterium]|nr:dihydroorotate dehydrogenase-like protein [Terrimicrobiaceae bacterium]